MKKIRQSAVAGKFYTSDKQELSSQIDYFIDCIKNNKTENINSFESAMQTNIVIDMLIENAVRI